MIMNITNPQEASQGAREIREALKNNCYYVYAFDLETAKEHRIVNTRLTKGVLFGKSLGTGKWFAVKSWGQK
jgi:hypothetical protein